MTDANIDDDFDKAFEGFGEEPKQPETPAEAPKEGEEPAAPVETPKEEPKPNEQPVETPKAEDDPKPGDAPKKEEEPKPVETPEAPKEPETPEAPQPLTKDDVTSIIRDLQTSERTSVKELETTTKDVMEAYYPEGLSHDLIDQNTGKVLKTPQDVVDASGGEMSIEQAAQWLMNEQFKLDKQIDEIESNAKKIAETTIAFKRDSVAAIEKYEPLFKAYPHLQKKVFDKLMQNVKADTEKGVILSAPDVMDHYDFYLEPYQQAFEFATKQPATNPVTPQQPEAPKPGVDDRLDDTGDAGATAVDDPNDFAQQVKKELANPF